MLSGQFYDPASIAIGDFNGDGTADLAVGNGNGSVTVLLGNGDGTFASSSVSLGANFTAAFVAAGDFNGDGIPDLAVANQGQSFSASAVSSVSILLGKGDGTFTPAAATPTTGSYPSSIAVGDLNGDGKADLAVTCQGRNTVTILLGNGDGTFTPTTSVPMNGATSIAVGDFNGDGKVDLATVWPDNNTLTTLLGNGDGTFTQGASPSTGIFPWAITASDFNRDGIADLAVANATSNTVTVLTSQLTQTATANTGGIQIVGSGLHQVDASYIGDSNYKPSVSITTGLTAGSMATALSLSANPTYGSAYGQQIVLTAILSPYNRTPQSTNGETITFFNGASSVGTATLSSGVATLNLTSLPAATDTLTASYAGDAYFSPTTSNSISYRVVKTTFSVVNTNADDSGTASNCASGSSIPCSLRDALVAAQSNGATITFDPTVFKATNSLAQNTITLGSAGTLTIPANTTIIGATSGTVATLTNLVTVSGNNSYGIFTVASGVTGATISNLTITNGIGNSGGAINNAGSLMVNQCTFSGNSASQGYGGAIENSGQLNVSGSTFANNSAVAAGGAIDNTSSSTLTINNSTFTANTGGQGGAIYNGGTLTMTNSTISRNTGSGAIFNNGLASGSNNILSGDTGGECAGIGCYSAANDAYFLVSGEEQQIGGVWDSGMITLGWNGGSYTVHSGQFSTPASISSTFGGGISNSGLAGAVGFGPYFVLVTRAASAGPITIASSSKSFTLVQVNQSLLFSSNGNVVGTAGNLSSLGNYGGPTQTIIPLPGSSAICAGLASGLAVGVNTDQRGFTNTNVSYPGYTSNNPCVDAGSVQTDYALSFNSQPPASLAVATSFTAAVTLKESGIRFTASSVAIPLTLTGNGAILNGSAVTASGIATYPSLSVSLPGANDKLIANLTLNGTLSITTPSNSFTVTSASTTTAATTQTVVYSPGTQVITLTAQVFSSFGTVNAGTVTFTVAKGTTPIGSAAISSTVSNGHTSAIYILPAGTAVGTYTIQAVYNAGGAFSTSGDNTQTIAVQQATPGISWTAPAAITYGTAIGGAQLDATASTGGTFAYTPSSGAVLPAGLQILSATFSPTDTTDYSTSTIATVLNVNKARLVASVNNIARVYGATNPIFTGTVAGAVNGDTFTESFSTTATAISIVGSYPIIPLVTGSKLANYTVTPTYGAMTISQAGTATTFALSNSNLTLTATVVSLTSGNPTGSVGFYEGQTLIGTGLLTNGVVTYTATTFPAGNVVVSALYSGDANFTESQSSPILIVSITPALPSVTVSRAGSVTDSLTLSTAAGFIGTLQLSCTGLPQGATCSFQPSSIAFTGTNNLANVTMTVQTGVSASAVVAPMFPGNSNNFTVLAGLLCLPGLSLLCFTGKTRKLGSRIRLLSIVLMLGCACTGMIACGSKISSLPQSPTGTSTVHVVATSPSGFSQTTSLTLTIQ